MKQIDSKPHIIYGKLKNKELRSLICVTSKDRKKPNAGRDLIEMREEVKRRNNVRLVRVNKKKYTEDEMLERAEKGENFKPGNFIAGMAPKQEKFCMEYIRQQDMRPERTTLIPADGPPLSSKSLR